MNAKSILFGVAIGATLTAIAYEKGYAAKAKDGVKAGVNRVKKLVKREEVCEELADLEDEIEDILD